VLVGGQGSPVWLAGVIEEICEESDQVQCDVRCCRTFQDQVNFQASHSRRAAEAHSIIVGVVLVVIYGEHVGWDGLVASGWESEERHEVTVSTHCGIGGEFVKIVAEGEVMEQEVCM